MYYPIMLDLAKHSVLIVGGGKVAYRRCETLVKVKAHIHVVALKIESRIEELKKDYPSNLKLSIREFKESDLDGIGLVIVATDNLEVNESLSIACKRRGILCNRCDQSAKGDIIFPATHQIEDITIAVSTQGKLPGMSKVILQEIKSNMNDDFMKRFDLLVLCRKYLMIAFKDRLVREKNMRQAMELNYQELESYVETLRIEIEGEVL